MKKILLIVLGLFLICPQLASATKLYITEYNGLLAPSNRVVQVALEPGTDQTPVDFTGGATQSASFVNSTSYVRLMCDVQCSVKFGTNPTATNANKPLPALTPEYFGVPPGQAYKISVIVNP